MNVDYCKNEWVFCDKLNRREGKLINLYVALEMAVRVQ